VNISTILNIKIILLIAIITTLTSCTSPSSLDDELHSPLFPEEGLLLGDENIIVHDLPVEPINYQPPSPVDGGIMTLAMRMPQTLNPLLNEDLSVARVLRLIYEPLIGLDSEHRPYSYLLSSFELSDDGRVATLVLRDDVYWEDGTAITAADIIFSLNTIRSSSEYSIYRHVIDEIMSYYIMGDDRTVAITYSGTNYSFAYRLNFPVIPHHHHAGPDQNNPSSPSNMSPLGNGAYRFSVYRPAQDLVLLPNNRSLRPRANIGRITVLIIPDLDTKMSAFNERVIDVIDSDVATWGRHRSTNTPNITSYANNHFEFIGFNFNNPILTDVLVRRAVAHAISVEDIISTIYVNQALRAHTPINPAAWFFEPGTITYAHNPELARRMLNEAGFSHLSSRGFVGSMHGGIVSELHLRILVNNENDERVSVAEILSDSLRMIQISTEVVRLDFADYLSALQRGDFDLFVGGINMPVYGDISFMFSTEAFPQSGGLNYFRYSSAIMDSLINQVGTSISEADFARSISQLQEFFAYELPAISLLYRKSALLTSEVVSGEIRPTIINAFDNIHNWFIER